MTVIYSNIAATGAMVIDHVVTGCENQILFSATVWGTTQVQVDSFSAVDPGQKIFSEFAIGGANTNWCIPCVSKGEVYRFTVLMPDVLTTDLFVEILEQGCCCTTSSTACFEIPVRLVPCE